MEVGSRVCKKIEGQLLCRLLVSGEQTSDKAFLPYEPASEGLAKEGSDMVKVYIALFTCCVTRAVHLDLVSNLSAPCFFKLFKEVHI